MLQNIYNFVGSWYTDIGVLLLEVYIMAKSIRRIFYILLSIALIVSGACLIGGCLTIYYSADGYSREAVAAVFPQIALLVYITLGMIAVGLVWELVAPSEAEYRKAPKAYAAALDRLRDKRDPDADAATAQAIAAEQARRRSFAAVRTVLILLGCAVFLVYAVRPSHYTDNINASVIRAMWVAIPCFVIPTVFAVIAAYQADKSYQREIALLKALPMKADRAFTKEAQPPARHTALNVLRGILLLLAVAALIYGFVTGGTVDVLTKAINICTECIGLG